MAHLATSQNTKRKSTHVARTRNPIPLDGSPVKDFIYTAVEEVAVRSIMVVYVEASSSHDGVGIYVGTISHPMYFARYVSEGSQSEGTVVELDIIGGRGMLEAGDTMTVTCDGFKSGLGMIDVQVELDLYR